MTQPMKKVLDAKIQELEQRKKSGFGFDSVKKT